MERLHKAADLIAAAQPRFGYVISSEYWLFELTEGKSPAGQGYYPEFRPLVWADQALFLVL